MQTVTTQQLVSEMLENARKNGQKIGFVPTMGALHDGHASLVRRARAENQLVVVSIFINPTQFNDAGDFAAYPVTTDADSVLLEKAGCDVLFLPNAKEMYPNGLIEDEVLVDLGGLDEVMEGKFRPGHFSGVVRIVKKLLEAVGECNAYFGEKDFQQLAIVKKMTRELKLNAKILGCPIIREEDGLAMSSRNMRLTPEERKVAGKISAALRSAKEMWGKHTLTGIRTEVEKQIEAEPLFRLDYFEIADRDSLQPLTGNSDHNAVGCIAVFLGQVRLIDNILLG